MRHTHLFCLLLMGFLIGCTPEVSTPTAETMLPTLTLLAAEPTQIATTASESTSVVTPTLEPVGTAIGTLSPTITVTPTVVAIPAVVPTDSTSPVVCDQVPAYINVREEMNDMATDVRDYFFEDENKITFLTWLSGPDSNSNMFHVHYSRMQLKGLTWDYTDDVLTERAITDQQPLQTPYLEDDYPVEVVGVSPNNEWQLLQITDAPEAYQGFWLVNQETVTQIIPYVPYLIRWQWSDDSEMLWLIHSLHDINGESYGLQIVVVNLMGPDAPQTVFNSRDIDVLPDLRDPYKLFFLPAHKTALTYAVLNIDEALLNEPSTVYLYDVSQNPPQQIEVFEVTPPFFIDWNDTLQDFVIIEFSATGGEIHTLDRSFVYQIPIEIIRQMPNFLGENNQWRTDANVGAYLNANLKGIGIAPDLHHVVLMMPYEAWAFACGE